MKERLQPVEGGTNSRLEHINVTTAQGNTRWHVIRRGQSDVSGASYGVDWWRVGNARKGLLHKLLDAFKRKFSSEPL